MVKNIPSKAGTSWKDGIVKNKFNIRPKPAGQMPGGLSDPFLQTADGPLVTDTTIANFEGNSNTEGVYPPDTHGDVGPNHYFQVVNSHYAIYSKTGALLIGPLANSSVFTGLPNNSNDGDAVVLYDEQADRWLFSQFSLPNYPNGPFYQMIAVSQTGDPTGTWNRYQYSFTDMPDYPKFGIWGDGYYMSMHRFTAGAGSWAGCGAVAYNRTLMLAGSPAATMVMFTKPSSDEAFGWLPSDCDGPFPTGNPPNYFLYDYDGASNDHLGIYEFHVDWNTTTNSTFTNLLSLPVTAFTANSAGITQPGTTVKLDVINDRMMYRLQYRSFAGYSTMVCNRSVDITTTVAGIRWYELRKTTGAWSIYQQGTYTLADNNSRWMGSIAMDSSGNMALGYSVSGSSLYPSIRYTGRKKNDALNQMTIAERGIFNGTGSQTGSAARWGDYSAMSCDPMAKATYWFTTEYYVTTSPTGWHTRIASFKFANNPVVTTNDPTGITCTGATLNGSVNPNGLATSYHFEWGTTASYGNNTTTVAAGAGNTTLTVNAPITGLIAGTTYHYRIVAVNVDGTGNGNDMTFIPCAATVITTAATAITTTTATAGGNVTSDGGGAVTARGTCWGTAANPTIAGSHTTDGAGLGVFPSSLTGLLANTTYHIRAYATNASGTSYGNDLTFTTNCGVYTLPFSQSFSATTIPTCWSQTDNQGNGQIWQFGVITGQTPLPALTGNYAFLNSRAYGAGNTQNADLVTPTIDMTGYTNITLQFNHYFRSTTGTSGTVSYSINNGTTWTIISTFTVTTTNPEAFSQVIPALTGQTQVKIRWNYTGTYGRYWGVDDVSLTGTAGSPTLSVTPPNQNVTAPAGTTPFTVTSNSAWTATSNQTWCTVTPSGNGSGTITATYAQNVLTTSRVANVTVTVTGLTPVVVTVTQAGAALSLAVTPPNQPVTAAAGATTFSVTTNVLTPWTVTSDQTWCTVTPTGTGNGTINATYTQNASFSSRVTNITVTAAGVTPVVVTVSQAGTAPTLLVTPPNQNVTSVAGNTSFTVTSNSSWIVTSDQTWCTVTTSGSGNGTILATYTENTTALTRVANITVTVAGISPVTVMVTQAGITPTLTVTPSNQDVTAPAGNTSFNVTTNSNWTSSSDQGWCTVTPSGTGNGTLNASYLENVSASQRVANITVLVNGLGPIVVTVTQAGVTPTLLVTPGNRNVTVAAGTTNFSVASNSNWTANSDASWCTVTPSGSGSGTIDAVYQENTGMNPRAAIITVSVNGLTAVTVTVSQEGLVGMPDRITSSIMLFPNPSTGKFTLTASDGWLVPMEVEVVNMEGKIISVSNCSGKDSYTFDLSDQPRGNYFLRITTAEGTAVRKVVVK
ncbi:MAG: BACON domain-containing carbohydrate-binding protein [Bacteroidetes bacterium]|nr:BACON domain-containing carbohydrate-binding protein [Bacteroidota bacterium]